MTSRCRDCGAPLYPRVFRQWNDIILGVRRTAGHGLPQAIEYHRGEATSYKGDLTIRIDNPFSGVILAGMIRGVYRAVEDVEGRCEWAIHPDGYMVVSVSPRLA